MNKHSMLHLIIFIINTNDMKNAALGILELDSS
jgi:hypothetical protein